MFLHFYTYCFYYTDSKKGVKGIFVQIIKDSIMFINVLLAFSLTESFLFIIISFLILSQV